MKIGPREDIVEEVRRYAQFVKFGVRLAHRVELLAHAEGDVLAAVCYSFAGGVFGEDVLSLDELLHDDERQGVALQTIEKLFDPDGKEWYAIDAGRMAIGPYFRETYGTKFKTCHERNDRSVSKIAARFAAVKAYRPPAQHVDGALEVAGVKLVIPRMNLVGGRAFGAGLPACLAYGDMHGGNVLVEVGGAADDAAELAARPSDVRRVASSTTAVPVGRRGVSMQRRSRPPSALLTPLELCVSCRRTPKT